MSLKGKRERKKLRFWWRESKQQLIWTPNTSRTLERRKLFSAECLVNEYHTREIVYFDEIRTGVLSFCADADEWSAEHNLWQSQHCSQGERRDANNIVWRQMTTIAHVTIWEHWRLLAGVCKPVVPTYAMRTDCCLAACCLSHRLSSSVRHSYH